MIAYLLNLLDLGFTLHAVNNGAVELNPVMQNIPFQIFYKVVVVDLLCLLLEMLKARKALNFCTAVFAVTNLWHIVNIAPSMWAVLFR